MHLQELCSALERGRFQAAQGEISTILCDVTSTLSRDVPPFAKSGASDEQAAVLRIIPLLCVYSKARAFPMQAFHPVMDELAKLVSQAGAGVPGLEDGAACQRMRLLLEAFANTVTETRRWPAASADAIASALCACWAAGREQHPCQLPRVFPQPLGPSNTLPKQDACPAGKAAYKPPHLRGVARPSSRSSSRNTSECGASSESDSSLSESDGEGGSSRRSAACKLRITALHAFQALVKVEGKKLHPLWTDILVQRPGNLATKRGVTLMDVIIQDPEPKVRALASTTLVLVLEGPAQRAYLSIAECRTSKPETVRGFTALSLSLGQMAIALHRGLARAVATEQSLGALAAAYRALAALVDQAPLSRLPEDLLVEVTEAAYRRLCVLIDPEAGRKGHGKAAVAAALSALSAALCTKTVNPALAAKLAGPHPVSAASQGSAVRGALAQLPAVMLEIADSGLPPLRAAALGALRGLGQNYPRVLMEHWNHLLRISQDSMRVEPQRTRSTTGSPGSILAGVDEERCCTLTVRVISTLLSSLTSEQDGAVIPELEGVNADVANITTWERARASANQDAQIGDGKPGVVRQMWEDAWDTCLEPASKHASAEVRAAGIAALAGITSGRLFAALNDGVRARMWAEVEQAVIGDTTVAVRGAAAKAASSWTCLPPVVQTPGPSETARVLGHAIRDAALSVRVSASAALANLADTLRQAISRGPEPVTCTDSQAPMPVHLETWLAQIAEGVLAAVGDNDKVQCSVARALGNLLACCALPQPPGLRSLPRAATQESPAPSPPTQNGAPPLAPTSVPLGGSPPEGGWRGRALHFVRDCLGNGNVKVRWNACYGLGVFLGRDGAAQVAAQCGVLDDLLASLLALIQNDENYKVRVHAASALSYIAPNPLALEHGPTILSTLLTALGPPDRPPRSPTFRTSLESTPPPAYPPKPSAAVFRSSGPTQPPPPPLTSSPDCSRADVIVAIPHLPSHMPNTSCSCPLINLANASSGIDADPGSSIRVLNDPRSCAASNLANTCSGDVSDGRTAPTLCVAARPTAGAQPAAVVDPAETLPSPTIGPGTQACDAGRPLTPEGTLRCTGTSEAAARIPCLPALLRLAHGPALRTWYDNAVDSLGGDPLAEGRAFAVNEAGSTGSTGVGVRGAGCSCGNIDMTTQRNLPLSQSPMADEGAAGLSWRDVSRKPSRDGGGRQQGGESLEGCPNGKVGVGQCVVAIGTRTGGGRGAGADYAFAAQLKGQLRRTLLAFFAHMNEDDVAALQQVLSEHMPTVMEVVLRELEGSVEAPGAP